MPERIIKKVMRDTLEMSYRRVYKQPFQVNSERCVVLRQQYALLILPQLMAGKRVINIDESWINETTFYRKVWTPRSQPSNVSFKMVTPRLALIAAIDTDGRTWYSLNQANTNSRLMLLFETQLGGFSPDVCQLLKVLAEVLRPLP